MSAAKKIKSKDVNIKNFLSQIVPSFFETCLGRPVHGIEVISGISKVQTTRYRLLPNVFVDIFWQSSVGFIGDWETVMRKKLRELEVDLTLDSKSGTSHILMLGCEDGLLVKVGASKAPEVFGSGDLNNKTWQSSILEILRSQQGIRLSDEALAKEFFKIISADILEADLFSNLLGHTNVNNLSLPDEITRHKAYYVKNFAGSSEALVVVTGIDSLSSVQDQRRAHAIGSKVAEFLRTAKNINVAIVIAHCQNRAVVLAPSRPRDYKVILDKSESELTPWVISSVRRLSHTGAEVNPEFGEINIDGYFANAELDSQFHEFCQDYKICLINELLRKENLSLTCTILRTMPDPKKVTESNVLKTLANEHNLQGHFLAVIDGLVLRILLHRFIEVYHNKPISPTHDELLDRHTTKGSYQKNEVGKKSSGSKNRFVDARRVKSGSENRLRNEYQELEKAYGDRFGGDLHEGSVHLGIEIIERTVGVEYLVELLDLTHSERYSFRYEDLRPEALEVFYEKSLELGIEFKFQNGELRVLPNDTSRRRKELGAYFTPAQVARFTVHYSLGELLRQITFEINTSLKEGNHLKTYDLLERFSNIKICDPTMGGGSFLKEAFRLYASSVNHQVIVHSVGDLPKSLKEKFLASYPWAHSLAKISGFEDHVLTKNLYGVDYDMKGLYVGSQTLTLEALHYLSGEERFPNFINVNLKHGNAFVSLIESAEDIKTLSRDNIKKLRAIREVRRATTKAGSRESSLHEEKQLREKILSQLLEKRQEQWGFDPRQLRPFTWEVEFPEVFFDSSGNYLEGSGFDCIIGNPPWENIGTNDVEFFESLGFELPTGRKPMEREKKIVSLLKDPSIAELYSRYVDQQSHWNQFLDKQNQYSHQVSQYSDGASPGKPNTYKLACESYWKLVSKSGVYGYLMPEGIAGSESTRDLRLLYTSSCSLDIAIAFNKENEVFPDATQAFIIWIGRKYSKTTGLIHKRGFVKAVELEGFSRTSTPILDWEILNQMDIETKPLIEVTCALDSSILSKFTKFVSPLKNKSEWGFDTSAEELNTTRQAHLVSSPTKASAFIFKGDHMNRYQSPYDSGMGLKVNEFKQIRKSKIYALSEDRVCWRDIAGQNDKRRLIASIVPGGYVGFNSVNIARRTGTANLEHLHYIVGVINSFVYEYLIRKISKNNHINVFLLKFTPFPFLSEMDQFFQDISNTSKALHKRTISQTQRLELESKCEALVAHLFGLSAKEFEFVLESFEKVEISYRKKVFESYVKLSDSERVRKKVA